MDAKTNECKVDRVIQWLTSHHLNVFGGYEHDYEIHSGKLFVADLDDAKERCRTKLLSFDLDGLPSWYDRAEEYLREDPDSDLSWPESGSDFGDWTEAFYETETQADH